MNLCNSIKLEYENLKKLKQEFVSACDKAKEVVGGSFDDLPKIVLNSLWRKKATLETARNELKEKMFVSPEAAERIMNKDMGKDETKRRFFGIDAIKTAFDITLNKKDIPPIPWSTQELQEAHERGDYLIYRPDRIPDGTPEGTPLTMQKIAERVQPVFTANPDLGKPLFDT